VKYRLVHSDVLAALREPVHPRRNVEEFAPVEARFVRFTIRATNRGEPCLDELEIYAADGESRNVALAAGGARATASGSLGLCCIVGITSASQTSAPSTGRPA